MGCIRQAFERFNTNLQGARCCGGRSGFLVVIQTFPLVRAFFLVETFVVGHRFVAVVYPLRDFQLCCLAVFAPLPLFLKRSGNEVRHFAGVQPELAELPHERFVVFDFERREAAVLDGSY